MRSRWGEHPHSPGAGRRAPVKVLGRRRDLGSVTAEFAAVMPAVIVVLACCLGAVQTVGQQVQLTDAAADGARSLARGDGDDRARQRVLASVPTASFSSARRGDLVCVTVSAVSAFGPAAWLDVTVGASGCALAGGL